VVRRRTRQLQLRVVGQEARWDAEAETAWRNHIQGKISAANRKPLLDRSLSQLWSGEPDP